MAGKGVADYEKNLGDFKSRQSAIFDKLVGIEDNLYDLRIDLLAQDTALAVPKAVVEIIQSGIEELRQRQDEDDELFETVLRIMEGSE